MIRRVYLDTNIYLDFLKDRVGETGRKLGDCATRVFMKLMKGELTLVFSDWNQKELGYQIEGSELTTLFNLIKHIENVRTEQVDKEEAKRLSTTNTGDALHAVLARKGKADVVITRNMKDVLEFETIMRPILPEMIN